MKCNKLVVPVSLSAARGGKATLSSLLPPLLLPLLPAATLRSFSLFTSQEKKNHTKISKSVSWGKLRPYPRSPHVTWQHLFWSLLSWPLHTPWTYTLRWLAFRSLVPRAHSGSCGMTAMALTTALWLDLRPTPQEKIHICYCEQGQKPIAREATDSKGRNYYCCSRWNSSRSSVSRETSPLLT